MGGPIFSHVIFVDIGFNFWKFQLFYSTTPHEFEIIFVYCRLIVKSIPSIHSYPFSNFFQLSIVFILSISIHYVHFLSFLYISIHFVNLVHCVQFYPCQYPFSYILSFFVHSYSFCQFFPICPNLWSIIVHPYPLMFVHNLLCPKALFENSLQSWRCIQL
jgi:hypothetical protein